MLLQYPSANSIENSPVDGKNERGFDAACLPTSVGSNFDTAIGINEYFFESGNAVRGDTETI